MFGHEEVRTRSKGSGADDSAFFNIYQVFYIFLSTWSLVTQFSFGIYVIHRYPDLIMVMRDLASFLNKHASQLFLNAKSYKQMHYTKNC